MVEFKGIKIEDVIEELHNLIHNENGNKYDIVTNKIIKREDEFSEFDDINRYFVSVNYDGDILVEYLFDIDKYNEEDDNEDEIQASPKHLSIIIPIPEGINFKAGDNIHEYMDVSRFIILKKEIGKYFDIVDIVNRK